MSNLVKGDDVRSGRKAKARHGQLWTAQASMGQTQNFETNQNNKPIIQCQCQTLIYLHFCPSMHYKAYLLMQETYRFLLLGRFKVAANKNQTIFAGWAQDTGK